MAWFKVKQIYKSQIKNIHMLTFWTYFQQKSPKRTNFGLKLLKKAPGGQKYEIYQKNSFTTLCIYVK